MQNRLRAAPRDRGGRERPEIFGKNPVSSGKRVFREGEREIEPRLRNKAGAGVRNASVAGRPPPARAGL